MTARAQRRQQAGEVLVLGGAGRSRCGSGSRPPPSPGPGPRPGSAPPAPRASARRFRRIAPSRGQRGGFALARCAVRARPPPHRAAWPALRVDAKGAPSPALTTRCRHRARGHLARGLQFGQRFAHDRATTPNSAMRAASVDSCRPAPGGPCGCARPARRPDPAPGCGGAGAVRQQIPWAARANLMRRS